MNSNNKSSENFNELVFENRNKAYGAYELRAHYNETVSRSLLITIGFFGILTMIGILFTNTNSAVPNIITDGEVIHIFKSVEIDLKPKVEPKVDLDKSKEAPRTDNGEFKAVDKKVEGLNKTAIELNITKNANPNGTKLDSSVFVEKKPPVDPNPPLPPVEKVPGKMPEFPDMARFIGQNLHYPVNAVENGTSGTVYVTFVVELDGSISDVKLLKDLEDGCGDEAIRVVKKMPPNWIPGMTNGKPVRSQCNLPIKFRIK